MEWQCKKGTSIHKTAKEFTVDCKRVREWCQNYNALKEISCGVSEKCCRLRCGHPLSIDLDQKVFKYLDDKRSEGRPVSNQVLRTKAIQIAGGLKIEGFKVICVCINLIMQAGVAVLCWLTL